MCKDYTFLLDWIGFKVIKCKSVFGFASRMTIASLSNEVQDLDKSLRLAQTAKEKEDEQRAQQIQKLSEQKKNYGDLIQEETLKLQNLEQEIVTLMDTVASKKKDLTGKGNISQRKLRVLENRLDLAKVRYNKQLAINKNLRESIDHFRMERNRFNDLYAKVTAEIEKCKSQQLEIVKKASATFEERDETRQKIAALQGRSKKDQHQHQLEIKDIKRRLDHLKNIQEFFQIKANERLEYMKDEEEKRKGKEANKGPDALETSLQYYEELIEKIQQDVGESNLCIIMDEFIAREMNNLSMFNYLNELSNSIDALYDEADKLRASIHQFNVEDEEIARQNGEKIIEHENKYKVIETETKEAEQSVRKVSKLLDQLRVSVAEWFRTLGCNEAPIREMFGGTGGISNTNLMLYIGLVEQRVTEIVQVLVYHGVHGIEYKSPSIVRSQRSQLLSSRPEEAAPAPQIRTDDWNTVAVVSADSREDNQVVEPVDVVQLRREVSRLTRASLFPSKKVD